MPLGSGEEPFHYRRLEVQIRPLNPLGNEDLWGDGEYIHSGWKVEGTRGYRPLSLREDMELGFIDCIENLLVWPESPRVIQDCLDVSNYTHGYVPVPLGVPTSHTGGVI